MPTRSPRLRARLSNEPTKVNPRSPNPPSLIAFHSPNGVLEAGLRKCSSEKTQDSAPLASKRSVLSSPSWRTNIANNGHVSRISGEAARRQFSVVKTCWRRKCDSNSHYRFEFRNPRRLRNLEAVQHLTRESTSSDWPLVDKEQSIFSSAHQGERHTIVWLKVVTSCLGKGATLGA
jgi:hypothetical protein